MTTVETPQDAVDDGDRDTPGPADRGGRCSHRPRSTRGSSAWSSPSLAIWIAFHIVSGGDFLTARNLWNLSVQSTSIAIMATGMVLIIVSRNIDLSVGSMLGFIGYAMALVQTDGMFAFFGVDVTVGGLGSESYAWIFAILFGLLLGAVAGSAQGFLVAYVGVPAFIVTLGGFLVWRGGIFRMGGKQGQTLAPLDETFQRLGGGAEGSLGDWRSWLLALLACAGIVLSLVLARRRRRRYELDVRPMWAEVTLGLVGCAAVIAGVGLVANSYESPITGDPTGIAYPVVILIVVTLLMSYLARRRRFGRYVYAYGGNPEAAELGGINTRRTVMLTFTLMGVLVAVSAVDPDRSTQRGGDQPRGAERARRHRGGGHRRRVVRRWNRHDPGRRPRCGHHAVAAFRHGAAEDRLAVSGHRGGRRARHRGGDRLRPAPGQAHAGARFARRGPGDLRDRHPIRPRVIGGWHHD